MGNSRPQPSRGQKQRTKSIYTDDYKFFVKRFVEARKASGLTQEQVAERVGQTQAFVSRCEQGQRRLDIIELRGFLRVFGLDFETFVVELNRDLSDNSGIKATEVGPSED